MSANRDRAREALRNAEREFKSALMSLQDKDYVGSLKYLQESIEYAAKAILMAYGRDYPKVHAVGRFLCEIEGYPSWFLKKVQDIAELTDSLARGRSRFRYPYEHPPEEFEEMAKETLQKVEKALRSCSDLIKQLFG